MSFASPSSSTAPAPVLDLSGLTDEDLFESESNWLNSLLAPTSQDETSTLSDLDTKLAKMLALLELATHDTSSLVDRTIEDISRSVPRLTFDLQLMRENALLLRFTLDGVRKRGGINSKSLGLDKEEVDENRAAGVGFGENAEVSKVMEKLRVLDLVKSRMEAARDVLREAESWSTLESEVTTLVAEAAFGKAAERLEEAARSMIVFQNTTEYEGRRALMVSLQNQLEASLSSSLVAAITSRDVKACKTFYGIFGQIQREVEFTAYYFGSRRSTLVEAWTAARLDDCSEVPSDLPSSSYNTTPSIKFTQFLTKFYSDLHSLLNEERTYVPAIFPNPSPTLSSFIQSTLEGLSPSLPQRLTAISDRYGPLVLPELVVAYKAAEEFAITVERIMNKLADENVNTLPLPSPSSNTTPKKDRRLSKRMSISKRHSGRSISFSAGSVLGNEFLGGGDGPIRPWETAIFEPFLDWQVDYPELERKYLEEEIARETGGQDVMQSLISGASEKGARVLWEHTLAVFGLAEDAVGRTLALTHGYGAAGLVLVIDEQIVQFMDQRRIELTKARKSGAKVRNSSSNNRREVDDELATLEGLEYSTEDWGTFQFGLKLLDTCRSITERLGTFETKLMTRLITLAQTVKSARTDALGFSIPGTTRGALTILRQSGLYSLELANLLTPLEKPSDSTTSQPPSSLPLLPKSRLSTTEFTRATQLFLHDTILAPLIVNLRDYSSLPAWTTAVPVSKGAYEIAIPTFSLSPSDTISRVGEGLFNLPRLFEVYADDDALAFSLETLPFVDIEALRALYGPAGILPPTPRIASSRRMSHSDPPELTRRSSIIAPPVVAPIKGLSAETVIATWLSSLTLAILSHLTSTILPSISKLSRHGASQLASDLGYISNVARALDVESIEFEAWREMAELEEAKGVGEEIGGEVENNVYEKMAKMRGWRRS